MRLASSGKRTGALSPLVAGYWLLAAGILPTHQKFVLPRVSGEKEFLMRWPYPQRDLYLLHELERSCYRILHVVVAVGAEAAAEGDALL